MLLARDVIRNKMLIIFRLKTYNLVLCWRLRIDKLTKKSRCSGWHVEQVIIHE